MEPRDPSSGVPRLADYPFDASARLDSLQGLDRLRCIADRRLAAHLFTLYLLADRNSREKAPSRIVAAPVEGLRFLGSRALNGELGAEARELAEYFLLDASGCERVDMEAVRSFARALRRLRLRDDRK